MKTPSAIMAMAVILAGCGSKSAPLRADISELIQSEEYQVDVSDDNGQVVTINDKTVALYNERLLDLGAEQAIMDEGHSVWKLDGTVYQVTQDDENVVIIMLDNPPKEGLSWSDE